MKKASIAIPNLRLTKERLRRGWSQKEVAEKLNTTPQNVCRWERGLTHPGAYFRQLLCAFYQKDPAELGLLNAISSNAHEVQEAEVDSSMPAYPFWYVPFWRNPLFTGQETLLENLHAYFQDYPMTCFQAIVGISGSGKTQIALEFAYRYRTDYQEIVWIRADTYEHMIEDVISAVNLFYHEALSVKDITRAMDLAKNWMEQDSHRLVILDDVRDLSIFSIFRPCSYTGHVLMTCSTHITDMAYTFIACTEVNNLDPNEGALLLLRCIGKVAEHKQGYASPCDQLMTAQLIAQELRGNPLAIGQAAAYIRETNCRLDEYLQCYREHRHDLLHFQKKTPSFSMSLAVEMLLENVLFSPPSVAEVILQKIALVEQENPTALVLMRVCAVLAQYTVPEELIINAMPILDPTIQTAQKSLLTFHAIVKSLIFVFFLRRDLNLRVLHLHPLVLDVLREEMDASQCQYYTRLAINIIQHTSPEIPDRAGRIE